MPKKPETITAYKAFNAGMSCRGFQYEVGKSYEHEGEIELCGSGFHACTLPFNCWDYYPQAAELARVSIDVADRCKDDSKVVGAKITIEAKLNISDWVKAQTEALIELCKSAKGALASGRYENAAATGDSGHAAATGYSGHAAATGYRGHAAATGDSGHAAATGDSGHAAATGDSGHAAATGDSGHAAATGYRGHAAATGYRGHAAATGEKAIAVSLGIEGTAMAGPDGWIVLAAHDDDWNLICVKTAKVGGPEGIKPETAYRLTTDGEFIEAA